MMRTLRNITLLLTTVISLLIVGCEEDQLTSAEIASGDDEQTSVLSDPPSQNDGIEGTSASKGKPKKPKDKCKKKDEPCDPNPRLGVELFLRIEDSQGALIDDYNLCAYSSATGTTCGSSDNSETIGDSNWLAEIHGDNGHYRTVNLNVDTQYILTTANSSNALYLYYEALEGDPKAKLVITNEQTGEGSFSIIDPKNADLSIVQVFPENISVSTPRWVNNKIPITWGGVWEGSPGDTFPTWIPVVITASVKLKDGNDTTTLASSIDYGTGAYNDWQPNQVYSSVKIIVEDDNSENDDQSSSFNVDYGPLDEVNIQGPASREAGQSGTWTASFIDGTPPFSYDWDYLFICNERSANPTPQVETCDTWYQGGTSSSWIKTVSGAEYDMKIALTVTDSATPPASDTVYLIVDIYPAE